MKILIVTSKNEKGCYKRIISNWFEVHDSFNIKDLGGNIAKEVIYKTSHSNDCCICLPSCIDPDLPEAVKIEIVVDEVAKILVKLEEKGIKSAPSDVFLLLHSGDLFPNGDARSENGLVRLSTFPTELSNKLANIVSEGNVFQFHHTRNDITYALMGMSGDDISTLFDRIKDIFLDWSEE